jgi:hypothetical protein
VSRLDDCDSGQKNAMAGFIGGLWPLADRGAAVFSTEFYGGLRKSLAG